MRSSVGKVSHSFHTLDQNWAWALASHHIQMQTLTDVGCFMSLCWKHTMLKIYLSHLYTLYSPFGCDWKLLLLYKYYKWKWLMLPMVRQHKFVVYITNALNWEWSNENVRVCVCVCTSDKHSAISIIDTYVDDEQSHRTCYVSINCTYIQLWSSRLSNRITFDISLYTLMCSVLYAHMSDLSLCTKMKWNTRCHFHIHVAAIGHTNAIQVKFNLI